VSWFKLLTRLGILVGNREVVVDVLVAAEVRLRSAEDFLTTYGNQFHLGLRSLLLAFRLSNQLLCLSCLFEFGSRGISFFARFGLDILLIFSRLALAAET